MACRSPRRVQTASDWLDLVSPTALGLRCTQYGHPMLATPGGQLSWRGNAAGLSRLHSLWLATFHQVSQTDLGWGKPAPTQRLSVPKALPSFANDANNEPRVKERAELQKPTKYQLFAPSLLTSFSLVCSRQKDIGPGFHAASTYTK